MLLLSIKWMDEPEKEWIEAVLKGSRKLKLNWKEKKGENRIEFYGCKKNEMFWNLSW